MRAKYQIKTAIVIPQAKHNFDCGDMTICEDTTPALSFTRTVQYLKDLVEQCEGFVVIKSELIKI